MNITDIFENAAKIKELMKSTEPLKVASVQHSSSIQIDEGNAEIASGTGM